MRRLSTPLYLQPPRPGWRNGIRDGLKHHCPKGLVGSNPTPGTQPSSIVGNGRDTHLMPHIRPQEIVDNALRMSDAGVLDREIAAAHGVAIKTIRRWRRDYQRRGKTRGQVHTSVACPRCDGAPLDDEAYAELLGWYLGDGWITLSRRGVYTLHVFNDAKYPNINPRILSLMRRTKPGGRPHTRQLTGCVATPSAGSTGRVCFRSTVLAGSTQDGLSWRSGSATSSGSIPGCCCAVCFTPMGAASPIGRSGISRTVLSAMSIPATSSPTRQPTSSPFAAGRSTCSRSGGGWRDRTVCRSPDERPSPR